jgi:hypothetical protein
MYFRTSRRQSDPNLARTLAQLSENVRKFKHFIKPTAREILFFALLASFAFICAEIWRLHAIANGDANVAPMPLFDWLPKLLFHC